MTPVKPRRRQQKRLAEGAAVAELGELQFHDGDAAQVGFARVAVVGQHQALLIGLGGHKAVGLCQFKNGCCAHGVFLCVGSAFQARAVLTRTALAAVLKGSSPVRRSVVTKLSPLVRWVR